MSARDVIARACFDPGLFGGRRQRDEDPDQWRARAIVEALAAAGYRILGRDGLDPVTVERCAGTAAGWRNPQAVKLAAGEMTAQELRTAIAVAGGIEAAIRSLIPAQPEAKEADRHDA